MSKGKRSKADGRAKEARRRARTADSAPRRTGPASAPDPLAVATRVDAWQFLLNYLNYVRDGGFDVPLDQFAPQRLDETAEEAELRRDVARKTKEVQALVGDWAELCTEVAARPTLALNPAAMVAHVAEVGRGWLKTAGHVPARDEWIAGARLLLGVLCPFEHWFHATDVLDQAATMGIAPGEDAPAVAAAAAAKPEATLHAAAALVAWLYGQRSVVFDQTGAMRTLARKTHALAESLGAA
uniref:hypothetical protein n=1 Tax=Amycolatopsis sp. CA-096443 TaxID=3239919 RepID=UPI003F496116